jgi:hypothetical protein
MEYHDPAILIYICRMNNWPTIPSCTVSYLLAPHTPLTCVGCGYLALSTRYLTGLMASTIVRPNRAMFEFCPSHAHCAGTNSFFDGRQSAKHSSNCIHTISSASLLNYSTVAQQSEARIHLDGTVQPVVSSTYMTLTHSIFDGCSVPPQRITLPRLLDTLWNDAVTS